MKVHKDIQYIIYIYTLRILIIHEFIHLYLNYFFHMQKQKVIYASSWFVTRLFTSTADLSRGTAWLGWICWLGTVDNPGDLPSLKFMIAFEHQQLGRFIFLLGWPIFRGELLVLWRVFLAHMLQTMWSC